MELFAREGANIIAVARRRERLEALEESLKDAPGKVVSYVGDVSREETNAGAIDLAVKEFGKKENCHMAFLYECKPKAPQKIR